MPRKPRQRPTAAPGTTPRLQGEPSIILYLNSRGNVHHVVCGHEPFNVAQFRKLGIPLDPSESYEPTHATCDANPDVEVPASYRDDWRYGHHPMHDISWPRVTRLCAPCGDEFGHAGNDWPFIIEVRERAALKVAA